MSDQPTVIPMSQEVADHAQSIDLSRKLTAAKRDLRKLVAMGGYPRAGLLVRSGDIIAAVSLTVCATHGEHLTITLYEEVPEDVGQEDE